MTKYLFLSIFFPKRRSTPVFICIIEMPDWRGENRSLTVAALLQIVWGNISSYSTIPLALQRFFRNGLFRKLRSSSSHSCLNIKGVTVSAIISGGR